jgi:hypothetical protein
MEYNLLIFVISESENVITSGSNTERLQLFEYVTESDLNSRTQIVCYTDINENKSTFFNLFVFIIQQPRKGE